MLLSNLKFLKRISMHKSISGGADLKIKFMDHKYLEQNVNDEIFILTKANKANNISLVDLL